MVAPMEIVTAESKAVQTAATMVDLKAVLSVDYLAEQSVVAMVVWTVDLMVSSKAAAKAVYWAGMTVAGLVAH